MRRDCRDPCCDGGYDTVVAIPEKDHNKLKNRDMENQHPISAITNLKSELDTKMGSGQAMSNMDIYQILES